MASSRTTGCAGVVVIAVILIAAMLILKSCGVGGWGPTNHVEATVNRLYIDVTGGKEGTSHYMVSTDRGTFEIDNGWLLGVWNADDIYGPLKVGTTYRFTTKGNRVVNFMMQEYPYIVKAEPVAQPEAPR